MSKATPIVHLFDQRPSALPLNLVGRSSVQMHESRGELDMPISVASILLLLGLACATPASADRPGRKFKLLADQTTLSPDHQIRIEQFSRNLGDWHIVHQFWTFDRSGKPASLLNRNEDADLAAYPAGFRFSPDSQWLVRM
jgi:hypothetical protein